MILKKNIAIGFTLCLMLFSMIIPFLFGLMDIPEAITGEEGVVIITQKDSKHKLTSSLVSSIQGSPNITSVSAEVIVPTMVNSEPFICRGVDSNDILIIDELTLQGSWLDRNSAVVGHDAAKRMDISMGDSIVITSPNLPTFCVVYVSGIYHSEGVSDGILISDDYARFLLGLGKDGYTLIRALTSNPLEMQKMVEQEGSGVTNIEVVDHTPADSSTPSWGQGGSNTTNSEPEIRLVRKYADFFSVSDSRGYTSTAFRYGSETVDVTVVGIGVMTALLVTMGILSLILRGISEGRKDLGVLIAIGAPKNRIRIIFLKDLVVLILLAAPTGIFLGILASQILATYFPLLAFGQTIAPVFTPATFILLVVGSFIIPVFAWVLGGESTISEHPKTLFTPIEIKLPSTPLEAVLEGSLEK